MGDLSEHFSRSEFVCKHCGQLVLDPKLVPALEMLRASMGQPIFVNDSYRCPVHNAAVGGVPHSQHVLGMAADIVVAGWNVKDLYDAAQSVPDFKQGGIGLYDSGFIHVDVRPNGPARWARVNGKYVGIEELLK